MTGELTDLGRLQEARRALERIGNRLLQPRFEILAACDNDLRLAAKRLRGLDAQSKAWKGAQRSALEAEVIRLRQTVRRVSGLLGNASKVYAGWIHLVSPDPAPPNYTPAGSPIPCGGPATRQKRLEIHG